MSKNKSIFTKKFKDFIDATLNEIMRHADLPSYTYSIIYVEGSHPDDHASNHSVAADISVLSEYQSFDVRVYEMLFNFYEDGLLGRVMDILCHEVGHIHTDKLFELIEEPYKTEREVEKVNEELTTKIGGYLYTICRKNLSK